MTAAHPLPIDDLDDLQVEPLDARALAKLSPEERALAEEALARVALGTLHVVPAEGVPAALAEDPADEDRRMSFRSAWDFPALVRFHEIAWPASERVDAAVLRFARERAPLLPSGAYRMVAAGHAIGVQVDAQARTVLVLYVYRLG